MVSKPPTVALISVPAPGLSAAECERLVVAPLEHVVATIEAVVGVQSLARPGLATVRVELSRAEPLSEVRARLGAVVLPDQAETPVLVLGTDPGPEFVIANDRLTGAELRAFVDQLVPTWRRLPGVAAVTTCGGDLRELRVRVAPERLAVYGIAFADVLFALNRTIPQSEKPIGTGAPPIDGIRGLTELLRPMVVSVAPAGAPIRLEDLATIEAAAVPDPCQCLQGTVCVRLELAADQRPDLIAVAARRALEDAPPGTRVIQPPPKIAAVLTHVDRDTLRTAARQAARWLSDQPGVTDVAVLGDDSKPEIEVRHNERCPVSAAALANAVRAAQSGVVVGQTKRGDVVRAFLGDDAANGSALTRLPIPLADGNTIPLGFCAELILSAPPQALLRHDTRPALALRVMLDEPTRAAGLRASAGEGIELPEGGVFQWVDARDLLLQRRSHPEPMPPGIWP